MPTDAQRDLRQHLIELLKGGSAHASLDDAIADLPAELRGKKPAGLPHSPWMLLEHIRIGMWDILEFSRKPNHTSPPWPKGYWPEQEAPPSPEAWEKTVKAVHKDLKAMQDLVADSKTDLFAKLPWGDGQTVLREALLVADHNAYHVAQLIDVRRLLGAWTGK
jgi:hypothetical protein